VKLPFFLNHKKKAMPENKPVTTRRKTKEVNDLRKRMILVKEKLPKGAVTKFISLYPEFNPYKKASRVRLVFNLSIVDEDITQKFEALVDLI
tara:strand:- start:1008 stop:1283 length:276 start_codon:yes stop_codon:yes gene_type:complete